MSSSGKRRGGFLFGAVVGAVVGLLLAPRSGKETREQLLGAGDGFGGQVERLKGAVEAGKEQAAGQSEHLLQKIEETRERLRRQMEAGDGDEDASVDETLREPSNTI
ncbi:MAG: YtxH domain-containing protein [Thermoleophilia bacterium]